MNLTEQQKQVLHHAIDNGWDTIEGRDSANHWMSIFTFSWSTIFTGKVELRIKEVPDSINWEHVSSKICGMARDEDGSCYCYTTMPKTKNGFWIMFEENSNCVETQFFSSYKQGTVSWDNSWVPNPFHKDNQVKTEAN